MGKRKSSKKPQTRVKQVLDKSFRCIFCAHQGSVTCKMDNKQHIGRLDCKDCGTTFSMDISHLDAPVDVYSSWIDAASEANSGRGRAAASSSGLQRQNDEEDDARRPAAAAARTQKSQPKKKQAQKKRARNDDSDEDSEEDDGDFDPKKSKKGKRSAPSDEEEGGNDDDEDEEEEAVESDEDLPNMDISGNQGKKPVKRGKVVDDEEDD
ncbi:hypothetical protein JCM11491_003963 [Sporobolomyces phaffii]